MTEEEKKAIEVQLLADCKAKEGGTDADVQSMTDRDHPTTKAAKCMSACVAETIGIVSNKTKRFGQLVCSNFNKFFSNLID